MMNLGMYFSTRLKNLSAIDIALIKFSTFFFALLIAKVWTGVLGLEWYWYLILGLIFAIRPIKKMYFSRAY